MIPPSKTILIVDDEPLTREGIRKTLEAWSIGRYHIISSSNGAEALEVLNTRPVHLLITDIRMPEISGLQVVEDSRSTGHKPVVIVISGHPDFQYAQTAIQLGVVNYLLKPIKRVSSLKLLNRHCRLKRNAGVWKRWRKWLIPGSCRPKPFP